MCVLLPDNKKSKHRRQQGFVWFSISSLYFARWCGKVFEEVTLIASFSEAAFGFRSHVSSLSEEGQWRMNECRPILYRHGCRLSAANIIRELPLSVHVPRCTVLWMRKILSKIIFKIHNKIVLKKYFGVLYYGCAENIENVTAPCERWGCFQVNYSAAVCAANIGKAPLSSLSLWSAITRMLATANRWRVSIRGRPCKNLLHI